MKLIPIPRLDLSVASARAEHDALVGLVEKRLAARGENCEKWESAINDRVYRLYGLTPEEIKMVEESAQK